MTSNSNMVHHLIRSCIISALMYLACVKCNNNITPLHRRATRGIFDSVEMPWELFGGFHEEKMTHVFTSESHSVNVTRIETSRKEGHEPTENISLNTWAYIGLASGVLVLFSIVLGLLVFLYRRRNKSGLQSRTLIDYIREFKNGLSEEEVARYGELKLETALKFPYDQSYEIPKDCLKIDFEALLGSGCFGNVYKASIATNGHEEEVALKMVKRDSPESALKGLLSEIKILIHLGKHINLVSIVGAYTTELDKGLAYLATELCAGSLQNHLRSGNKDGVSYNDMLRWSYEIACAMEYLGRKQVIHADLATRNVLLTLEKVAKVTDFGLSRRLYEYTNYVKRQQEPLPWKWMAIESLNRLEFSSKSDVWSYGVTLWEIFADGNEPYPGLSWDLTFVDSLANGLKMNCPPRGNEHVYNIMRDCWHLEPSERPSFADLKEATASLLKSGESVTVYIDLND